MQYVRPGATIIPGGAVVDGGAPNQVRPPVTMGSIPGRGRGDWRPIGINKFAPILQRNFHSLGRSFGNGMEFTLPSHKYVFAYLLFLVVFFLIPNIFFRSNNFHHLYFIKIIRFLKKKRSCHYNFLDWP